MNGVQQIIGELSRRCTIGVGGDDQPFLGVAADVQGLFQLLVPVAVADVSHQLTSCTDDGAGVGVIAAAMIDEEGSGAVNGLEQGVLIADVGGRSAA